MKILFLVATSKTHIHESVLHIDRVDLTRKLDAINTWVIDVINSANDVIFFDGGNESVYYDENSRTLHLTENDGYENDILSILFPKVKSALKWALENKEFDMLYLCDDDIYINIQQFLKIEMKYDYMGTGSMGGGGFFFNKKSINTILNYENTKFRVCDQAIYDAISSDETITKFFSNEKSYPFYLPGELYATIHYVTGKRSYFLHNIFNHFNENGYTNRKIILGGGIDMSKANELVSYESTFKRKTPRWYDFTIDPNGWEFHGGYVRSLLMLGNLENFWPYAENSTKMFVLNFNALLHDYRNTDLFYEKLNFLINKCEYSLIDERNLFLLSETNEDIDGWMIDESIKEQHKLNFELLNEYNFYKKNK